MMDDAAFWDLVRHRRLAFCRCRTCGNAWLPASSECPRCLKADGVFETASGEAKLLSWVVFHKAYSDTVKDRVPYVVALVELAEGPRMTTNILGDPTLYEGQALWLSFAGDDEMLRPCFATKPPAQPGSST